MYLVKDWEVVILIEETNVSNTFKYFAFPIPNFDEETFPFIVILGRESLSFLNVKTTQKKTFINQQMVVGLPGL